MTERDLTIVVDPAADEFFAATLALKSALETAGIVSDGQVQVIMPGEDLQKLTGHEFEANRLQFLKWVPDRERQKVFADAEMLKHRVGRIHIDANMIDTDIVAFAAVMGQLIVVRCESIWHLREFDIMAISPAFDVVERGRMPPEYRVTIQRHGPAPLGWCDVSFERLP